MADTRRTPISPWRAAKLSFYCVVLPQRLAAEESADNEMRKLLPDETPEHRAYAVRRAFWRSSALVALSVGVGLLGAQFLLYYQYAVNDTVIQYLQIAGGGLLLWGTLFVRGWDIQTIGGVSLTERVNQWLYRALYCAGTCILTLAVRLAQAG